MEYRLTDLFDLEFLQRLTDYYYGITNIATAIMDVGGSFLAISGWQKICTDFHRKCPQTEVRCSISDRYIQQHINDAPYTVYECLNGLIDYAAPIEVDGHWLGTVFTGQILHCAPDRERFKQQACEFGFDETAYLQALDQVLVVPPEHMEKTLLLFSELTGLLAKMGLERKQRLEAEKALLLHRNHLQELVDQRTEDLRLSEEKFAKAFAANPLTMAISTLAEGRYIDVNDAFCELTGYPREMIVGQTSLRIWHNPHDRQVFKQMIMEHGFIKDYEINYITRSGELRIGLLSGQEIQIGDEKFILSSITDITERRRIDREMARLDGLNLIGEMAASIGHEIRNPMTTVRGLLQMLTSDETYLKDRDLFALMIEEMDRANSIISEFLSLAKDKRVELLPRNLSAILSSVIPLIIVNATAKDIKVDYQFDPVPDRLLDEKEIRQLILNLAQNGLEAMTTGTLSLRVYLENRHVVLSVQDQGPGIDPAVFDKLGMPFVTTKEQGTGLGLSVCYRIAAHHYSRINVETGPKGTTFYVHFPG